MRKKVIAGMMVAFSMAALSSNALADVQMNPLDAVEVETTQVDVFDEANSVVYEVHKAGDEIKEVTSPSISLFNSYREYVTNIRVTNSYAQARRDFLISVGRGQETTFSREYSGSISASGLYSGSLSARVGTTTKFTGPPFESRYSGSSWHVVYYEERGTYDRVRETPYGTTRQTLNYSRPIEYRIMRSDY